MKKFLIILGILCFIITPTFASTPKTMNKLMESWLGEDIDEVINIWGNPTSKKDISGGTMYYWTISNKPYSTNNYTSKNTKIIVTCNIVFTANSKGKIVDWQWDGNNCLKRNKDIKNLVNPKVNY